ncbi:hypothetical protein [Lactococcus sp.]|uniref:hypothetical protein n=1 Tax=Lactococcus sp. TaxID=44273 RepID=UPI0035B481D8
MGLFWKVLCLIGGLILMGIAFAIKFKQGDVKTWFVVLGVSLFLIGLVAEY